jgi:hypothetical protein
VIYPCGYPGASGNIITAADPAPVDVHRYNVPAEAVSELNRILDDRTLFNDLPSWIRHAAADISLKTLACEGIDYIRLSGVSDYSAFSGPPPGFPGGGHSFGQILTVPACAYAQDSANPVYEGLMQSHPRMQSHTADSLSPPPKYYYLFAGRMGLFPDTDAGHVKVYYTYVTDDMQYLPEALQPLVFLFVQYMARVKDKRLGDASVFYNQYMQTIAQYRSDVWERLPNSKEEMQVPDRIFKGGE